MENHACFPELVRRIGRPVSMGVQGKAVPPQIHATPYPNPLPCPTGTREAKKMVGAELCPRETWLPTVFLTCPPSWVLKGHLPFKTQNGGEANGGWVFSLPLPGEKNGGHCHFVPMKCGCPLFVSPPTWVLKGRPKMEAKKPPFGHASLHHQDFLQGVFDITTLSLHSDPPSGKILTMGLRIG